MDLRYLRLFILCLLSGIVVAIVITLFRWVLTLCDFYRFSFFTTTLPWYCHIAVILAAWLICLIINFSITHFPIIAGSGIPQTTEVVTGRIHFIHPLRNLFWKFLGSISSIGLGFSLSRGGPAVEIGSLIGRFIGNITHTPDAQQRYIQTAAGGAGISAAFTTPLSSTIFMIEGVTHLDSVKIALSTLLSTGVAGLIVHYFFPHNAYTVIDISIPDNLDTWLILVILSCFAVLISILGKFFNSAIIFCQQHYKTFKAPVSLKLLLIVLCIYFVGLYFPSLISDGEGFLLNQATTSIAIGLLALLIIAKIILTAVCYSTGFPGGIFLPLLVIGGLTGKFFGMILAHFDIISLSTHYGFFMILGMAAFFATSVRTPITGIVFTIEITQKFEVLFPTIIFVGSVYFISQVIGVRPIYDVLYKQLVSTTTGVASGLINVDYMLGFV